MFLLLTKQDNRAMNVHLGRLSEVGHDVFVPLTYEALACMASTPELPVIFTEAERLTQREAQAAQRLLQAARRGRSGRVTLNDPGWTMGRYELLRTLHARGVNSFNALRAVEPLEGLRYPVFIRYADRHAPILSALLPDRAALDRAIADLTAAGALREALLVVEYLDYAVDGAFVKYCAYRLGDEIVPAMRIVSREWEVRDMDPDARTAEEDALEAAFMAENPHREALMEITDLARVSYGRVDYTLVDGKVQVFEINTNPSCPPAHIRDAFFAALAPLQDGAPGRRRRFQGGARGYALLKAHETVFALLAQGADWLPVSAAGPLRRWLHRAERWTGRRIVALMGLVRPPKAGRAAT